MAVCSLNRPIVVQTVNFLGMCKVWRFFCAVWLMAALIAKATRTQFN